MTTPADEEFTELVDADFPRVDLVGKGANGVPRFLIAKSEAGLLEPGFVRDLIAKADPEPVSEEQVTMTGSPAAIAKLIHGAPIRATTEVSKESDVADTVTKADLGPELDKGADGLDPTIPLAAPEEDAPGDPTAPGSPAWEAIDAATAAKWAGILSRAKVALGVMADRELLEAAAADPADAENAWDLEDACCAIDYAISVLAPFAVSEQSEVDTGTAELDAIGKALAGFDPAPLEAVEGLASIAKAGRVLSAVNETRIREAAASLQSVLQTLPAAPVADDQITKEATVPADQTDPQAEAEVAKEDAAAPDTATETVVAKEDATEAEAVAKADAEGDGGKAPQVAVYDASGNLVGIADPADITPIKGADAPAEPAAEEAAPAEAAPADPADMAPAPAADAGTPAEDVAKQDDTITIAPDVLESIVAKAVTAALGTREPAQDVAKQADVAAALGEVETLKARIETLEAEPAMPKVFTNGAVPPAHQLRGQDRPQGGLPPVDVAKAAELKGTLYKGTAPEQNQAAISMQEMAIAQLSAIHGQR